jgi:hypothetical protein
MTKPDKWFQTRGMNKRSVNALLDTNRFWVAMVNRLQEYCACVTMAHWWIDYDKNFFKLFKQFLPEIVQQTEAPWKRDEANANLL